MHISGSLIILFGVVIATIAACENNSNSDCTQLLYDECSLVRVMTFGEKYLVSKLLCNYTSLQHACMQRERMCFDGAAVESLKELIPSTENSLADLLQNVTDSIDYLPPPTTVSTFFLLDHC